MKTNFKEYKRKKDKESLKSFVINNNICFPFYVLEKEEDNKGFMLYINKQEHLNNKNTYYIVTYDINARKTNHFQVPPPTKEDFKYLESLRTSKEVDDAFNKVADSLYPKFSLENYPLSTDKLSYKKFAINGGKDNCYPFYALENEKENKGYMMFVNMTEYKKNKERYFITSYNINARKSGNFNLGEVTDEELSTISALKNTPECDARYKAIFTGFTTKKILAIAAFSFIFFFIVTGLLNSSGGGSEDTLTTEEYLDRRVCSERTNDYYKCSWSTWEDRCVCKAR